MSADDDPPPVEIPITGELDLHAFAPRDIRSVALEYLQACREQEILLVRLVHGRGQGVQRAELRRLLECLPWVEMFHDAAPPSGGWGATIVCLKPRNESDPLE